MSILSVHHLTRVRASCTTSNDELLDLRYPSMKLLYKAENCQGPFTAIRAYAKG